MIDIRIVGVDEKDWVIIFWPQSEEGDIGVFVPEDKDIKFLVRKFKEYQKHGSLRKIPASEVLSKLEELNTLSKQKHQTKDSGEIK